jgi:hypothetical protein
VPELSYSKRVFKKIFLHSIHIILFDKVYVVYVKAVCEFAGGCGREMPQIEKTV